MTKAQRGLVLVAAVLVAFFAGFLWQYMRAVSARNELRETRRALTFEQLEATLGAATIEALEGRHEAARQLASSFFAGLQQNVGQAPAAAQNELTAILGDRDAVITALARGDPQSGPALAQLYRRYRGATAEGPPAEPTPATPPASQQ